MLQPALFSSASDNWATPPALFAELHAKHGFTLDMFVAQGMTEEEADEHFEYNVIGGWLGEGTPIFLVPVTDDATSQQYE